MLAAMLSPAAQKTLAGVRALRIQGAENVARACVDALALHAQASKARTREAFLEDLAAGVRELWAARPTEPALRNALRYLFVRARANPATSVGELKKVVADEAKGYRARTARVKEGIARYGARLVPKDASVLVHCHSSTLMRVLKRAHDEGRSPRVLCTESRPLYQGHVTARELSSYGLKVTMFVDGAAHLVLSRMRDTDLVMVGADAVTAQGDLVNKVGTAMVAHAAYDHEKRFYSCTASHKFDPQTLFGWEEPIEERAPGEVADPKAFKGVKLFNPAFDLTPARLVTAYVTELGVLPPQSLVSRALEKLGAEEEGA
jgi:ribose 1,5-bisphosphate isomerase